MKMEDEVEIPNEEYETQFFGFSPTDVFEGIKELIKDRFEDTINKFEKQMKTVPKTVLSEDELQNGISELRSITKANIDSILLKLEKHLLGSIMKIPAEVLLPEDAEQGAQSSQGEYEALLEEIEGLKKELKKEKFMQGAFQEELKDIEMVLRAQEDFIGSQFSTSNQARVDEKKEKLTFLAANVKGFESAFEALRVSGAGCNVEEFEVDALQ